MQRRSIYAYVSGKSVKAALKESGAESIRERCFPNHIVVYYVLALALFMSASYREVMRCLLEGAQRRRRGFSLIKAPNKSGISKARRRVGYKPFEVLYGNFVRPIATKETKGAWYKNWKLITLDGSVLEVADTEENELEFGRHNSYRAKTAFPQLRFATLIETGTRVMFGMKFGCYSKSELALAKEIIPMLEQGCCAWLTETSMANHFWNAARKNGADLLWRSKCNTTLPPKKLLEDGSYLSKLYPSATARRRDVDGVPVRVIEYQVDGSAGGDQFYRLITTILDPQVAPSTELAMLYHERWEIETGFRRT